LTRKLDFVVFGLPRGGTTAVANYISAVPELHCGVEVFPTYMDHATLDVPGAFVERQHDQWNSSSADEIRARGDVIRYFGNKTPTYFYRLPSLLVELDNCPAIACVRDLRAVATSYSKRAGDADDPWVAGRTGLFAMADAILMLQALNAAPEDANILIVSQAALLADWRATMTRAVAHIAPDVVADFAPDRLRRIDHVRDRLSAQEKPTLSAVEERALRRLTKSGAVGFFARPDVVPLSQVRAEIADILTRTPPNPVNFLRRLLEDDPNPAVQGHFERWSRQATRAVRLYRPDGKATG
jgi:hypothetical protein